MLEIETDLILSEMLRLLEPSLKYESWAPIIILEVLRHLLKCSQILKYFYIKYDMNTKSDKRVFGSLIHGLGRFLHQTTNNYSPKLTQKWSPKRFDRKYFSFVKDIKNPPTHPSLQISLAVLSLVSFVEGLAVVCNVTSALSISPLPINDDQQMTNDINQRSAEPKILSPMMTTIDFKVNEFSLELSQQMVEVIWRPLLGALSHMLTHSVFESQFQQILSIYQTTSRICGRIRLIKPLENLLRSMSEHALPHPFLNYTFSDILFKYGSNSSMILSTPSSPSPMMDNIHNSSSNISIDDIHIAHGMNAVTPHLPSSANDLTIIHLSIKNVCTIHALVNIAHGLSSMLSNAWSVLLETFEKLDYIFHRQNWKLVDNEGNDISPDSHWNDEVRMLDSRLQQLFESSIYLDDDALCELLSALGHLSSSSLAGLATTFDQSITSVNTNNGKNRSTFNSDAVGLRYLTYIHIHILYIFVYTIDICGEFCIKKVCTNHRSEYISFG